MNIQRIIWAMALSVLAMRAATALDTEFTYQGELRSNSVPVQGSYDFEFRLFDLASGGTPVAPLQARAGVQLVNGRFGVNLDFGDVLQGQDVWLEIAVRAAGQPSFAVLAPRQALRGAPHALHAEFVADDRIGTASVVDGAVQRADIATSSINSGLIANGAIVTPDFSNNAVSSAALAGAAVTAARLADDAVANGNLANAAVNTSELANNAVTRAKIAAGAVRASHVDSTQVQLRISGMCLGGTRMQGFDASGAPICPNASHQLPTQSGLWPKLALRSDARPVVAYYDADTDEIKLATCGDETCATAIVRTMAAVGANFEGSLDLVLRADDTAFLAYRDAVGEDLYAVDCLDETCASKSISGVDVGAFNAGTGVAVVLRPAEIPLLVHSEIAYRVSAEDCSDRACSSSVFNGIGSSNDPFGNPLAAIVSATGLPLAFSHNTDGNGLIAHVCLDNDCVASSTFLLRSGTPLEGLSAIMGADGVGVVAYRFGANSIRATRCAGGLGVCESGTETTLDTAAGDSSTDMALGADGNPRVVYRGTTTLALRVCADAGCTSSTLRTPDAVAGRGQNARIALRADGRPVLAYEDFGRVRVTVCAKVDCAP